MASVCSKKDNENYEEFSKEFKNIDKQYIDLVEKASNDNKDFFISNSTIDHASFLTYMLIKRAKENIKLYTGNLLEGFYDNKIIINTLGNKIKEGVKLQIVTERDFQAKKCLKLREKFPQKADFRVLKTKEFPSHFLLVDNIAFRFEYPHTQKDFDEKNFKIRGQANFNNKKLGEGLNLVFEELLRNSESVRNVELLKD